MMSLRLTPPLPLLFLLMGSGVAVSHDWSVDYTLKSICALKRSTVTIGCRYTYPDGYTVQRVFWSRELVTNKEPPDLSLDPKYRDRVQYLGDTPGDCSLRLSDVTEQDQGNYYFRFITTPPREKYQGQDGVELCVTDPPKNVTASISPSAEIVEGSSVTLTCSSDANPPVENYTWFKETSYIGTGKTHSINTTSSEDSGNYSCQAVNEHRNQSSTAVSLNVLYPPKNVSVSISPSGEIVEGSTVTLTCSSDANPPVEYNWFKGNFFKTKDNIYTIENITSEGSGGYKCKSSNQYGVKYSNNVTVNVLYPPKNVSVSISPSGEIVEGSTVTLTCSSDANPPVEYNWFKGTLFKTKDNIYTIENITSEGSGGYKCKSSNQYGVKYSNNVTLNVLYPPKRVSVSISPSGEIVDGSTVNLTCSSDANPPVQTYTWYKVDESSPVGSGQSYSFTLSSSSSGWFYCVAQNKYGTQRATAVPLTINGARSVVMYVVLGIMAVFGCLFAVIGILYMRRKRRRDSAEDDKSGQENTYSSVSPGATNNPVPEPDRVPWDDVQYAVIQQQRDPRRTERSAEQTAGSEAAEEVQYATVQHQRDRVMEKTQEDNDQYSNVRFNRLDAAYRSADPEF